MLPIHRSLFVLMGVIVPMAVPAQAQPVGLFEGLFGVPARPVRHVAPVPVVVDQVYSPERARAAAAARRAHTKPEAYAGLPATAVAPARPAPRKAPAAETQGSTDALSAVMTDPTLRPGDIVMFPDGPRVFNGQTRGVHHAGSFEPVGGSRLVGRTTRAQLADLKTHPVNRPTTVKLQSPTPSSATAVRSTPARPPRVVYRDTPTRL